VPYSRAIFIYLEPRPQDSPESLAQCGSCRMWVPPNRCIIHGAQVEVDDDDSCGFWVPWPKGTPNPEVIHDHRREIDNGVGPSVTPSDSGLVDELVQCHRCVHFAKGNCGLYQMLNQSRPDLFKLEIEVDPHGCCNAWSDESAPPRSFLGAA
jgi:hypothetical protein